MMLHQDPAMTEARLMEQVRGRYLAVSTTLLYGPVSSPTMPMIQDALRKYQPVARTMTFLIYDFTHEPARPASTTHANRQSAP